MALGPYAAFIAGSYGLVAVVVVVLVVATLLDHRHQTRRLRDLERAGVSRRSGRGASETP